MDRVRWIAALGIAGALAIAATTARDVERRIGAIEPELVLYQNAVVGPAFLSPGGAAYDVPGLKVMDHVVAVDGAPVRDAADVARLAEAAGPDAELGVTVLRASGERIESRFHARRFSESGARGVYLPFLLGGCRSSWWGRSRSCCGRSCPMRASSSPSPSSSPRTSAS